MRRWRLLRRLFAIQRTLVRHRLDDVVSATHLFRPIAWLFRLMPRRRADTIGVRLRFALEELGPVFVKFGQAVATRRDLLPGDVADELAKLQDQVPPFDSALAVAHIEKVFGQPVDTIYDEFEPTALAAASIAQVHAAQLPDGTPVVVKLLRPGMEKIIRGDLDVLYALADLAERYWEEGYRLRPREVVEEYEKTILNELDLLREAANAAQLRRNFSTSNLLYVPEVYWDYCRPTLMTMERVKGVPINDIATLTSRGTNFKRLAEHGVEIFFTQVFEHNFFHADMHSGNIFVDVEDPDWPRYVAVDFGIVGSLTSRDQRYLAENFLAFFNRDYRRVAQLHINSGWVPANTRVDELEAAVRAVCEPIFNKPLKDISFGIVLLRLFETARRFQMEVQPQLVLLQKTLLTIEGLGRQLYPELDLWQTAKPILETWMERRADPVNQLRELAKRWPDVVQDVQLLPDLMHRFLSRMADDHSDDTQQAELDRLRADVNRLRRQSQRSLGGGALVIAGAVLLASLGFSLWWPWSIAGAGVVLLFWPVGADSTS
ncbi:MAG: ubiquinone biosynthesis regulatory protein kinase UbiB [Gammaproteobacteria bacterium]